MEVQITGTPAELGEMLRKLREGPADSVTQRVGTIPFGNGISLPASPIVCTPKSLPPELWGASAKSAIRINPVNRAAVERMSLISSLPRPAIDYLAVVTTRYWGNAGVNLTVGFLDNPPSPLRARILMHMNAWSKTANVHFAETSTDPQVRISRTPGGGYWSYLGTDITHIPAGEPTMNLDSFSADTPDSEFFRVVRHETGHTLGCPHEHLRRELVARIDPDKAIAFYGQTQHWPPAMVRQQVLTPIEDGAILATPSADQSSIMCYQIPGAVTRDGQAILGGIDIDASDYSFIATIYPPSAQPAEDSINPLLAYMK